MKLGVFSVLLGQKTLEEALIYLSESGVQAIEIGTGGYPGKAHANTDELLSDDNKIKEFKELVKKYNIEISALSCHGNPVHPQKKIANKFHEDFKKTILLAEKLGIKRIVGFSGCPGDSETSQLPNWVTCSWPEDFMKVLNYQWNDVLIPYWREMAKFAKEHRIEQIALEMHPGFCVYNPETLLRLRSEVGDIIGANLDPSHLFWQGIDPVAAIKKLGSAIYFVHAKDTKIDKKNTDINGVLDIKHYAGVFRTVGYGHDAQVWKDIISTLRLVGYDDVISIEHEDSLMSVDEGLQKAIKFLKEVMLFDSSGEMWWA